MIHKVNDVELLYQQSKDLYERIIREEADEIISNLKASTEVLKNNWKGIDAGVQINNIVNVHNELVRIRNYLAKLAGDSSLVAVNYREIQRINRGSLEALSKINTNELVLMNEYVDNRDTIDIEPDAINGKKLLDIATADYDEFKKNVSVRYNELMDNWQSGPGRDNATEAFNRFMTYADKYKLTLMNVSQSISIALKNYNI